jgi:hypothetical protein
MMQAWFLSNCKDAISLKTDSSLIGKKMLKRKKQKTQVFRHPVPHCHQQP